MLKQRLIAALALAVPTLLAFLLPGRGGEMIFMILVIAFSAVAIFEFMDLTRSSGLPGYPRITVGAATALIALVCFRGMALRPGLALTGLWGGVLLEVLVFVLFLVVLMTKVARSGDINANFKRFLVSVAALSIVIGTVGFIPRLYFLTPGHTVGRRLLLYLILVTKFADVGAYAVGMWTARRPAGNHKMIPSISPKKSWEGLAGGTAAAVVVALVFMGMIPGERIFGESIVVRLLAVVVFGIFCSIIGLLGDLGESLFKRATGADDSGAIPGLGGVLDVVDSLILVAPLFYLFVSVRYFPS